MGVKVIGKLESNYDSTNRIYDVEGCSPTLSTMQGGNQEPKILEVIGSIYTGVSDEFQRGIYPIARSVKAELHDLGVVMMEKRNEERTLEEQIPCKLDKMPDGHLDSLDNAKICDVDTKTASTITARYHKGIGAHKDNMCIVAMRGRNPDNPSDRTTGSPTEQRLEINTQGTSNTLTTVQKDNLVLENLCVNDRGFSEKEPQVSVGEAPTLRAQVHGNLPKVFDQYRIRKLTPRECGRLMDVLDSDIDKMAAVNSDTQLYKQFGNSIVKAVMCAMFRNLNIKQEELKDE